CCTTTEAAGSFSGKGRHHGVWGLQEAHAADSSSSNAHCVIMFGRWLSFAALIHGRPSTNSCMLAANMLVRSVIRGSPAPVYCIGAPSIYKAIRIVCEAGKNFEDKSLAVKPEFRDNEQRGSALVLRVHDEPKSSIAVSEEPETVMQVASRSLAVQIAGAIASRTRDGTRNINLQAAGAQAVGSAVLAVAFARLFLSNDGLTKPIKQEKEGDPETLKVVQFGPELMREQV
ncbi:uncharacterized protein HaLaN_30749, partial [Haematococcus lacustris]